MGDKAQQLAQVVSHLIRHEVFRVGPVEITSTVTNTWLIMAIMFVVVFLLTRRLSDKPRGAQVVLEIVMDFLHSIIDSGLGKAGRKYVPLVGTFFIFILFLNLSWFIPGMIPPTSDLMTTLALGVVAVLSVHIIAVRKRGLGPYLLQFTKPNPIMTPLNIIEELVRPCSLALRLFGNMFGAEMVAGILFALVPILVPTPVMTLDVLMGAVQAYIFSLLAVSYLASALHGH